jgi:hypothetical protein
MVGQKKKKKKKKSGRITEDGRKERYGRAEMKNRKENG